MKKTLLVLILAICVSFGVFANAAPERSTGEIELHWASIWVGQDSKAPACEELVAQFNEQYAGRIKVVVDPQPDYNAYEQTVRTSLAAGSAPADIFTIKLNPTTELFYQSDLLLDFNKVMTDDWKATFAEGTLEQSTRNGVLRSLPMETAILPMWFNMDAFKAAGYDELPDTWEGMLQAFDALRAAGYAPTSQMTGDTNAWTSMIWFSHFAVANGGVDVWTRPFTDSAFVDAAEKTKMMVTQYSTDDAINLGAGGSGGHFLAGRTAVFSNGPWYAGRADLAQTPFFNDIKIANLPGENFNISRLQANICAAATKDAARQDAIVTFLKYLTSADSIKKIASTSGAFFAIKTDYVPSASLPAQFAALANSGAPTAYDLEAALGAEATLEFTQQLSALCLGQIDSQTFCQRVEARIDR